MENQTGILEGLLGATGMSPATLAWWGITTILAILGFVYRTQVSWWIALAWYKLPFIGKLARLSRDTSTSATPGWLNSERTLSADFKKFIHFMEQGDFRNRLEYIKKAQDGGRKPMPAWLVLVLFLLVAAEGLGFSYLLGSWMAREGSANVHTMLMFAIVFVLATVLAFITEKAGHQLYRTNLVRACRKNWNEDGKPGRLHYGEIGLDEDQYKDDDKPNYSQTLHRVGTSGTYVMAYIAAIAIIFIAVGSTWMRVKSLEGAEIESVVGAQAAIAADPGNPFAAGGMALPPEVAQSQKEAQAQAQAERREVLHSEGLAAFTTLAVIFLITQVVGIYAGHHWGFAGKYSKAAYKSIRGFATYNDFVAYYEPRLHAVQSLLSELQQRLEENVNVKRGAAVHRTFLDYLNESHHSLKSAGAAKRPEGVNDTPRPTAAPELPSMSAAGTEVATILSDYDRLDGKEARLDFLRGLDEATLAAIKPILAERKEQERKRQSVDEEFADLV